MSVVGLNAVRVGLALASTLLPSCPAWADEPRPAGVVVAVGELDPKALSREAAAVGGADWRGAALAARPRRAEASQGREEVRELRKAYLEADFLRCLALLQRPALDINRMLELGRRRLAGQVAVLAAACARGAGDLDLSRTLLERIFVRQLDTARALGVTGPDFQAFAETVRARVHRAGRVSVSIRSRPAGARLVVDGGAVRCATTPCRVTVLPGEHIFAVERLGYMQRTLRVEVKRSRELVVGLDAADSSTALAQLRDLVSRGSDPGTPAVGRLAALAFGAQVVALAWHRDGQGHAFIFDRRRGRIVSRVTMRGGSQSAARALRAALVEWRGAERRPLYARPAFYLPAAGVVAAAVGVGLYFALRPRETHHDLVFR